MGLGVGVDFGVFVGVAVDVGAAVDVGVGVNVGLGDGAIRSVEADGVGEDAGDGEVSFCTEGEMPGVADGAALDAIGVGDLCAADGDDFVLDVGVGRGDGVC